MNESVTLIGTIENNIPLVISAISLFVALLGASPLLVQFGAYRWVDPFVEVELKFHGDETDEIEWWRLDPVECKERLDEETVQGAQFYLNRTGSKNDIFIDKIEFRQDGEVNWEPKEGLAENGFIVPVWRGRYFVHPDLLSGSPILLKEAGIMESGFFPRGGGAGLGFPFDVEPADMKFEIIIHTSIDAEEISIPVLGPLPRLFGRIKLQPVRKEYTITSRK